MATTNTRHKNFGAPRTMADYEPVTFVLADQEFTCKAAVQGSVLLKFISDADSNQGGRAATAMRTFFADVMDEDEVKKFYDLIDGEEYIFDMESLAEITSWLVETYSARPTAPSKPSSAGRKKAGTTSTANLSSVE
jgi:hypothetical protein